MPSRNIVLIGYRGTGKSTVAKILGERLGRDVVSIDETIVAHAGKTIPEIVSEFGWDYFRNLESAEIWNVAERAEIVIDAGGGAILRKKNVEALKKNGIIVLLTAAVPTIAARIGDDPNRPSLTGKSATDEIVEVLRTREPLYRAAADHVISTDDRTPDAVAEEILAVTAVTASFL